MIRNKLPIICIMGATCTGKTDIAINLFKRFPVEIISVDSAMIYKEMNIGTDKPSIETLNSIKHHLINIREPNEEYNVADFYNNIQVLVNDIHSRNKIPLLVGGSLMYFNSLYTGLSNLPSKSTEERNILDHLMKKYSLKQLHSCLKSLDLTSFGKIKSNDKQRIQRALEVYMSTGEPMSTLFKNKKSFFESFDILTLKIFSSDRQVIHNKIETRMTNMFNRGFIEEVKYIIEKYDLTSNSQSMKILGYKHVLEHLVKNGDISELKDRCLFATRQLAKRQITWLKQFPSTMDIDILDNDPTIIYKAVDSHCNLGQ